jgi:hypothetical protein
MGLLTLDKGITFNLNKATISQWFRIPQSAFDITSPATSFWGYDVFNGVIPFIVFGKQLQGPTASAEPTVIGNFVDHEGQSQNVIGSTNRVRTAPTSPSLIGVVKGETSVFLFVHLQTADLGNNTNTNQDTTGWVPLVDDLGQIYGVYQYTGVDASYADNKLEFFSRGGVEVSLDAWHHLLISWDLGSRNSSHGTATIDSSAHLADFVDDRSKLYCALDDKNIIEFDLPALWVEGGGANDVICDGAFNVAGRSTLGISGGVSTFSVDFATGINVDAIYLPADSISYARDPGPPWEVPSGAGTETGNVIQKVEMAELQIFAGLVTDTGVESNRRAFIDFERDEDGNKVLDEGGKGTLKPVKPAKTEELLGHRPDILLHGTSDWIAGKNTGSTGLKRTTKPSEPDEILPAGQFDPTGTIQKYTPDPALGES